MSTENDEDFERRRVEATADLRVQLRKLRRVGIGLWFGAAVSAITLVVGIAGGAPVWLLMVMSLTIGLCVWRAYDSAKFYRAASQGLDHLDSAWDEDGPYLPDPPDDA